MSQYENFFSDFGLRCFDIFNPDIDKWPDMTGPRDVTKALCILSGALTIPHERLRPYYLADDNNEEYISDIHSHHPGGDPVHYKCVSNRYCEILRMKFIKSLGEGGEWNIEKGTAQWGVPFVNWCKDKYKPISQEKETSSVLTILRNSLSHGNIQTIGDEITRIMFISVSVDYRKNTHDNYLTNTINNTVKYECIAVSPIHLLEFMKKWRDVLTELGKLANSPIINPQCTPNK